MRCADLDRQGQTSEFISLGWLTKWDQGTDSLFGTRGPGATLIGWIAEGDLPYRPLCQQPAVPFEAPLQPLKSRPVAGSSCSNGPMRSSTGW